MDTDVLSAVMRQSPPVVPRAHAYLEEHHSFTISVITQYEILRGLRAKAAETQIRAFALLCRRTQILPVTSEVAERAAGVYAELHRHGQLIGEADILISATALVHDCGIVTHNTKHFGRVSGLHVEDWLP